MRLTLPGLPIRGPSTRELSQTRVPKHRLLRPVGFRRIAYLFTALALWYMYQVALRRLGSSS